MSDDADRVHHALATMGAEGVLRALGVDRVQRGGGGVRFGCPVHGGRDPNASARVKGGRLLWTCHSHRCHENHGGDALGLVAGVHGLDVRREFPRVLEVAAALAGVELEVTTGKPRAVVARKAKPAPPPEPPRHPDNVAALWSLAVPVGDDDDAAAYLAGRGLDVGAIEDRDLARVLPTTVKLPRWARLGGRSWTTTGHRIVVPTYDATGAMRSLRGWRWSDDATPKRLAPAGCSVAGLVMADALARMMLELGQVPPWWPSSETFRAVVCEGEPDFLTWATLSSDADETAPAVLGIESGAWTDDVAARVPTGSTVIVRTHHDDAGDAYAAKVIESLRHRCVVKRSKGQHDGRKRPAA